MEDQKQYVEGLEAFFAASNENMKDVDGIIKQMPEYAPRVWERIQGGEQLRILDVGSGNGEKSLLLGEEIRERWKVKPQIDFIEPTSEQRLRLLRRLIGFAEQGIIYNGTVFSATLHDFKSQDNRKYDVVLFLHSLYQFPKDKDGIISDLGKVKDLVSEDGSAIAVLEDYEADFQRMKRELYPIFGRTNLISIYDVERSFQSAGFSVKRGNKIDVKLSLDKLHDFKNIGDLELGTILGFLFSTGLHEHDLTEEQYAKVGRWVRANLKSDQSDGNYLDSANAVLWVYPK